ncbi:hypothetical protein CIW61_13495 [Enterobacter cloacae]|nr:hypothetical protein CIW61_13495 [Enterobacter cloacae]
MLRKQKKEKNKQFALSHLVTVHTAPVVSVRLRVALYFVNIFLQCNRCMLCRRAALFVNYTENEKSGK